MIESALFVRPPMHATPVEHPQELRADIPYLLNVSCTKMLYYYVQRYCPTLDKDVV